MNILNRAYLFMVFALLLHSPIYGKNAYQMAACVPAWNQFAGADRISSTILSSLRGNDDLIYLGGRDGLYRIEGGDVHTWYPDFTNDSSLPSGQVSSLVNNGQFIWVATNTGIARLNTDTGLFERNVSVNQLLEFSRINALKIYKNHLFIGGELGAHVIALSRDINNLEVVRYYDEVGAVKDFEIADDKIISAGVNGLWQLDLESVPLKLPLNADNLVQVVSVKNDLWAINNEKLFRNSNENSEWLSYDSTNLEGLPESGYTALTFDSDGRLWIGARDGISRWDLSESHPQACRRAVLGSRRDEDISIAHLAADLGDYIFLGSRGRGASYSPLNNTIRRILPGYDETGLPSNSIWSHYLDANNRFYAGTSAGLYRERLNQPGFYDQVAKEIIGDLRVFTVTEIDNHIWVGTTKGLFVGSGDEFVLKPLMTNGTDELVKPAIYSVKVNNDHIFVASSRGLIVFNKQDHEIKMVFKTKEDVHSVKPVREEILPIARIWSVDFLGNRTFIAGNDGVFEVDITTGTIVSASVALDERKRQPIGYIYNVLVVDDNTIYLGTESGLVITNSNFSSFERINEINGRKLTAVMSSGRDSLGNLWFGVANNGLFRLSLETGHWTHLTQSKGLITNGISQLGLSFNAQGYMSVSNATGASIVDLKTLQLDDDLPLKIRAIDGTRNHSFSQDELYYIGPDDRDLKLSFMVNDLVESGLYQVEYHMTSNNSEVRSSTVPLDEVLSFINLSPGNYTLSAVIKSTSGASSLPINFQVEVTPHWYESSWFYAFNLLLLMGLILSYFIYKTRHIEERLDIISVERKRIAQDLHDTSLQDVFGAKMQARMLVMDLNDKQNKDTAQQFLTLLDQSIASLRKSVNSLSDLETVPALNKAIEQIDEALYLPEHIHIVKSEHGKAWRIKHQRRFFLYRIIREATINAIKHSCADTIEISLNWSAMCLTIEVSDNGNGFDVSSIEQSDTYGMQSMFCMAKSAKSRLSIDSAQNKGTKVVVSVPRISFF